MYNVKGQRSAALTKFKSIIAFPFYETIALKEESAYYSSPLADLSIVDLLSGSVT